MPLSGKRDLLVVPKDAFFENLEDVDNWAASPLAGKAHDNILPFYPRPQLGNDRGKLLVCHDYKGGYTESPFSLSYTFNFWSSCDIFVYFSHHRVTIPPPGWINASHRQGVKMLGTLIFENGAEEDCLRLLVGKLPKSRTAPAVQPPMPSSLPISSHYARVLADLAQQRGFDGYLLNFECPLRGGIEQTRALAAWITLLQFELKAKVGDHAEVSWYDSVVFTGQLAWQDRLNTLNLPFFLSSSSLFSNYTWRNNYPSLTAQYFMTLDPSMTGGISSHSHIAQKKLQDIYMGVDVWGRGSHGNGGFGSYKAISHIAPNSLGLSVAIFGQAWTWESEQDKPGWTWESWWTYERKLWAGPIESSEEIIVPEMPPLKRDESPCEKGMHDVFIPLVNFFDCTPPPDPLHLPFHTTFSPGVGRRWFVDGVKVFDRPEGWTDVDKQTSLGDLVWPAPSLAWEGDVMDPEGLILPQCKPEICMDDAWNGGTLLKLNISTPGTESENATFRCVWLPVQSLAVTAGRSYEASLVYKLGSTASNVDLDLALSIKAAFSSSSPNAPPLDFGIQSISSDDAHIEHGWSNLVIQFTAPQSASSNAIVSSTGVIVTIVSEDPNQPSSFSLLLGQLNVYPAQPSTIPAHVPALLWADFQAASAPANDPKTTFGTLSWEIAASLGPSSIPRITSPEDTTTAWPTQPSAEQWFPRLLYANVYALPHHADGTPGQIKDAIWIGTSGCGYEGTRYTFEVVRAGEGLPNVFAEAMKAPGRIRFYVQGVTDRGEVLPWVRCVYVDT